MACWIILRVWAIGGISKLPVGRCHPSASWQGVNEKSRGALHDSDFPDHKTVIEDMLTYALS
jgi:hypothetical protein